MKYDYTVKLNGIWYPAGTEIPEIKPEQVEVKTDENQKAEVTGDKKSKNK